MPIRAILIDLDNTLLLEDEATEQAVGQTAELAERLTGADPTVVAAAAREAAASLFEAAPVFAYAGAMGIWWGEALWGDFAGDQPGLAGLRAFVPAFRRAVWTRALSAAGREQTEAEALIAAYARFRRALRPIDPEAESCLDD